MIEDKNDPAVTRATRTPGYASTHDRGNRRNAMTMTEKQRQEFEAVTRPVIEWLNNNCHPHVTVVIDTTHVELSEGVCAFTTHDYLRD